MVSLLDKARTHLTYFKFQLLFFRQRLQLLISIQCKCLYARWSSLRLERKFAFYTAPETIRVVMFLLIQLKNKDSSRFLSNVNLEFQRAFHSIFILILKFSQVILSNTLIFLQRVARTLLTNED